MQEKERVASQEAEKRLKAALTAKREPNAAASRVASPMPGAENTPNGEVNGDSPSKTVVSESLSGDVVMESGEEKTTTPPEVGPPNASQILSRRMTPILQNPWLPELYVLFDDVRKIAPGNTAEIIGYAPFLAWNCACVLMSGSSPAFYLTFWQMSTYDLSPPAARYEEECSSLRALSRTEDSLYIAADRSPDRARRMTAAQHRDRRNRINMVVSQLNQELKDQTAARAFTIKRLAREKQHWFAHSRWLFTSLRNRCSLLS